jgi:hypothetical protein
MTTTRSRKKPKSEEAPATQPDPSPDEVLAVTEPEQPVESPAEEPVKEARSERDGESTTLVYRGHADVFEHGALRIRPGQPVEVPSDVAEELLTYPHERFEKVVSQE